MEHSPTSPHPTSSASVAPTPRSLRTKGNITVMQWFGHLLKTRPLAFWSGVWVSVCLIGVVAVGSLLSPSASERRSVSAIALGSDSGVATQPLESRGKVPFWMFGAIAVTCTAGSLLVSRRLNPNAATRSAPPRRRQVKKLPSLRQPAARSTRVRTKPGARHQPQRLKPYVPTESLFEAPRLVARAVSSPISEQAAIAPVEPVKQPVKQFAEMPSFVVGKPRTEPRSPQSLRLPTHPSQVQHQQAQLVEQVPVMVVPAEHVHPLDWNQPRLADAVDLRKQKPAHSSLI